MRRCAAVLACLISIVPAAAGAPRPQRVRVEIGFVEPPGSATWLDALERALVPTLENAACFKSVAFHGDGVLPEADLVFRVSIGEVEEELDHDLSMAQRDDPNAPPGRAVQLVARAAIDLIFELRTAPPADLLIRQDRVRKATSRRPLSPEDSREAARREVIELAARNARTFMCKGSARRLDAEIDRAKRAAARR
jgi:hypothetical protein